MDGLRPSTVLGRSIEFDRTGCGSEVDDVLRTKICIQSRFEPSRIWPTPTEGDLDDIGESQLTADNGTLAEDVTRGGLRCSPWLEVVNIWARCHWKGWRCGDYREQRNQECSEEGDGI